MNIIFSKIMISQKLYFGFLIVVLLIGCNTVVEPPKDKFSNDVEEAHTPEIQLIIPPEKVMNLEPIFSFKDLASGRVYYIRTFQGQEVVSVKDIGKPERLADPIEREYAIAMLEADWRDKNFDEKLKYHQKLRQKELERDLTLLESLIHYKNLALQELKNMKWKTDVRIRANEDIGINKEETEALKHRSAELAIEILIKEAELKILEYDKIMRDTTKATDFIIAVLDVRYILRAYQTYELELKPLKWCQKLINDLKQTIAPQSWLEPRARLEIRNNFLIVRNTKKTVNEVKAYVDVLTKYSKIGKYIEEAIDITHILKIYRAYFENPKDGDKKLLEEIKQNVEPQSWHLPGIRLEINDNNLIIRNTGQVIEKVKKFLWELWSKLK